MILLHTDESAGYPWGVVRTSNGSWRFDIARTDGDQTPYLQMRAWMTDASAKSLVSLAGANLDDLRAQAASRDFKSIKLNVTASINLKSEVQKVYAPNVVGLLEGGDAKLKDEYVVYSAHWDHLGIGAPNAKGDAIYNGAVDNATGVAAILEIAQALAKLPPRERPKRSFLFLFPTAEEQGLIGAEWFIRHPVVPLSKIAANINLDSMNILGPTQDLAPLGAERSTLSVVFDAVARERRMSVVPDRRPEQGSFYRSDHFPFAKAGIPAVSMKEGLNFVDRPSGWGEEQFKAYNAANYHQPSDEYQETWDFRGVNQQIEIAMQVGRRVADAAEMPRYNPSDEFAKVKR
ncbi:MAG: M28 family peptidase [Pyrinomonadaceae bacterium]